jgi:5-methylcytosine-specific restriction protein A
MSRSAAHYQTKRWRWLRAERLLLDAFTCTVPGCGAPAVVVDHIVSPRNGGADTLENTRSLCRHHDNQIKENAAGKRRRGGTLTALSCDAQGSPLDPQHWWNR